MPNTPVTVSDLDGLTNLQTRDVSDFVWMLDACTVQKAVIKHERKIDILLQRGNFRILRPVLQELKAWQRPALWHPLQRKEWGAVQEFIQIVESKWGRNIREVRHHPIGVKLTRLTPLLSKVLVYDLIMRGLPEIYHALLDLETSFEELYGLYAARFHGGLNREWHKRIRGRSSYFTLRFNAMKQREVSKIGRNRSIELKSLLQKIYGYIVIDGLGQSRLKSELEQKHKVKLETDIQQVLYFLISDENPKRFPAKDKDVWELVLLYKYAKFK
jgi:hypothetical protein